MSLKSRDLTLTLRLIEVRKTKLEKEAIAPLLPMLGLGAKALWNAYLAYMTIKHGSRAFKGIGDATAAYARGDTQSAKGYALRAAGNLGYAALNVGYPLAAAGRGVQTIGAAGKALGQGSRIGRVLEGLDKANRGKKLFDTGMNITPFMKTPGVVKGIVAPMASDYAAIALTDYGDKFLPPDKRYNESAISQGARAVAPVAGKAGEMLRRSYSLRNFI